MNKFIYFRCSTDNQDNERQLYTIKEFLAGRNESLEDYQIFSDEGVSGGTTIAERQTKEILKQLKGGDLILVVEMSRMSRNFADRVSFISYCDKIGAKIYSISKKRYVTLDTSDGGIVDIMDSWQDASFLRNLRKATRQGVNKAKSKGVKFGKANENYTVNETKQAEGRLKYARTRTLKTIQSEDFKCFCRILKRSYDILQAPSDSLQAPSDLFMLSFSGYKTIVTKSTTRDTLLKIIEQMRNAKADNNKLFANYKLDDSPKQLATIRAKISNTFRTIDTYIINNK
jgi:DNA invertase Pin-like site-specific DNA recombinase